LQLELEMANDELLYEMLTNYRDSCNERNIQMSVEEIRTLVLIWNERKDYRIDDFGLRTNVNYFEIRGFIASSDF
jgi:hypothetical protein